MNCKDVQRYVHAYIDDELDPQQIIDVEAHLTSCDECRGRLDFERWFKGELQQTVGQITAPVALYSRVRGSLDREERTRRIQKAIPRIGLVAALFVGVVIALMLPEWLTPTNAEPDPTWPLEFVAERHSQSLPVEVSGPDDANVSKWFRNRVGFAVQPPQFPPEQTQFVGAGLSNVGERPAAHLIYDHNGHPITVFVFEDSESPTVSGRRYSSGNNAIYTGQSRGYNVVMWRNRGVSYAASSDLAHNDMIRLVSSAW